MEVAPTVIHLGLVSPSEFLLAAGKFCPQMQNPAFCFQQFSFGLERATQNGSGEGKSRIPSGIEGWAGFLPPAIPAGLDSTYPSRTPGGGVFAFLRFSFEVPGAPSSVCEGGAFALNQQVFTRQAQTPHRGSYRPRKIRVNYLGSLQPGWGVVQSVGHLTVNEDGVGSSPTAPANPSMVGWTSTDPSPPSTRVDIGQRRRRKDQCSGTGQAQPRSRNCFPVRIPSKLLSCGLSPRAPLLLRIPNLRIQRIQIASASR